MTNNDILRRIRYAFDLNDSKVIALFSLADLQVTRAQISDWLKKEDDDAYQACSDIIFATFLNGFINDKRGKRDGEQPKPESRLTNNLIFKKLRIALALQDDSILSILSLVDYRLSKHELSAFFRKPDHRQYRDCKDQILRNFLHGLQVKYRPDHDKKSADLAHPKPRETLSIPKKSTAHPSTEKQTFKWKEK